MELSLKLLLKLVEFKCETVIILQLLKKIKNFATHPELFGYPRILYHFLLLSIKPIWQLLAM